MDLRLPGISGVEAIRTIRETAPDVRFIVLTTYDGDEDIRRALEAGAQAYLLKAMSHDDVTAAIRKVHCGLAGHPASRYPRRWPSGRPQSQLSPREVEVLELIADGLSNKEIGRALGITEATVKWHVNIILSRLNVADRTEAIVAALQRGIMHLRVRAARRVRSSPAVLLLCMRAAPLPRARLATRRPDFYSRRVWQSADGLPEDLAQAFAQTPDGYLWIGTSGGLGAFDGVRFAVFNRANEPAFRDDSVYSLLTTRGRDAVGRHRRRRAGPLRAGRLPRVRRRRRG